MKKFIKAVAIRAVKTFFQAAAGTMTGLSLLAEVDWRIVLSASLFASIYSVATSFATGLPEVNPVLELGDEMDYLENDEEAE